MGAVRANLEMGAVRANLEMEASGSLSAEVLSGWVRVRVVCVVQVVLRAHVGGNAGGMVDYGASGGSLRGCAAMSTLVAWTAAIAMRRRNKQSP